MLNPCPSPPIEPGKPMRPTDTKPASSSLPRLWDQIDPASRRQLAQMVADLIRRLQFPTLDKEAGNDHPA